MPLPLSGSRQNVGGADNWRKQARLTKYMQVSLGYLRQQLATIREEDEARLSPLAHGHYVGTLLLYSGGKRYKGRASTIKPAIGIDYYSLSVLFVNM